MRTRLLPYIAILVLLGAGVAHAHFGAYSFRTLGENVTGVDDAYVSFRYARHIAEGHGAVYNPGERVEGYSNPLFVALTVPGFLVVPASHIYWWSVGLNGLFLAASLLVLASVTRREVSEAAVGPAVFVFALCPVLWAWMGAGLEAPLVLLIQLSLWAVTLRPMSPWRNRLLSLLAAASVLARPDGVLVPMVCAAYSAWHGDRAAARRIVVWTVVSFAALTMARFAYYGDVVPNTYYVKVDGEIVWRILSAARQLLTIGSVSSLLLLVCVLLVLPACPSVAGRPRVALSTLLALTLVGYWVYLGGDVFDERFLLLIIPMGIVEVLRLSSGGVARVSPIVPALVLMAMNAASLGRVDARFQYQVDRYDMWSTLGHRLRQEPRDALLAIDAAGKAPYFSELRTVDMLGLTDRTLARSAPKSRQVGHMKFDADYILARQPDLIAAWIATPNMDLAWGLDAVKYRAAGYRVRFLVNSTRSPMRSPQGLPADIIDVTGLDQAQVEALSRRGYQYAVLAR